MNIYKTDIDTEDGGILFYEKIDIVSVHEETTIPVHILKIYLSDFGVFTSGDYHYINVDCKDSNYNILIEKLLKLIRNTSINKILS